MSTPHSKYLYSTSANSAINFDSMDLEALKGTVADISFKDAVISQVYLIHGYTWEQCISYTLY